MPDPPTFRLVSLHKDEEVKQLCDDLSKQAESGELVGSVVIALRQSKKAGKFYTLHLSGWASNNPTFSTGAMSSCLALLQELALKEAGLI